MCDMDNLSVLVYVTVEGWTLGSHYGTHCVLPAISISVHKPNCSGSQAQFRMTSLRPGVLQQRGTPERRGKPTDPFVSDHSPRSVDTMAPLIPVDGGASQWLSRIPVPTSRAVWRITEINNS